MKAFSHINIGEKISFIIGCKNYRILVVSKKTDKPCANCTRTCAICTSFNLALQALASFLLLFFEFEERRIEESESFVSCLYF